MKSTLFKGAFKVVLILVLLFLATSMLKNPHDPLFGSSEPFLSSAGNASQEVRNQVLDQLRAFQAGYTERDTSAAEEFSEKLISRDEIVILGTMPREIFVGSAEATGLIREDWISWGNCTFLIDDAHVSAHDDVAWFSTVGYVEFDLSRFLVMPLRLTGVMVNEEGEWRFQQLQFQFDLDMSFLLVLVVVLLIWLSITVIVTVVQVIRGARMRPGASQPLS